MSGGYNYADAYSRYRQGVSSDSDFEKYVDAKHGSYWKLIDAYNKGEDVDKKFAGQYQHPAGLSPSQQAEYWQKRGANSKAAFGRAHAAEDASLRSGTYQGGTKVKPWEGDTTFETWNKNKGKKNDNTETPTGPIQHDNPYFPMLTQDYSSPASQDWAAYMGAGNPALTGITAANPAGNKGLLYQPWTSDYQTAAGIPNNLWNYAPPEGIDYAVRYTNPLTGKLDMNLMPAKDSKTGDDKTGAKKGSDKAKDLAAGRTHHPEMYDANDMWIGAEGPQGDGTNSPGFSQAEIATGIAVDYGGKWGDRQMGLNMLGNMGMFGNAFGAAKSGTGFGGDIEAGYNDPDIEHSGVTGAGSGGWT